MFSPTITIAHQTELGDIVGRLSHDAARAGIGESEVREMASSFLAKAEPLLAHGERLYAQGSAMAADTVVSGDGYKITLKARFGVRRSLWQRLLRRS